MSQDIDLTRMSEQELIDLNRRVVARLKHMRQARRYQELARFNVGDTVSFMPESGRIVVGTVVRLNQKTATVATKDGESWRVSPSLLSMVQDGEPLAGQQGELISLAAHVERHR